MDDEQARRPRLLLLEKAALCAATTAHGSPRRADMRSLGPRRDPRDNPCRRQGDQVVAPARRGAGWWLRTTMAPPAGADSSSPIAWRPSSAHCVRSTDGRPGGGRGPLGDVGRPGDGRPGPVVPAFARGCGRRPTPWRRARLSSLAGVSRTSGQTTASGQKRASAHRPGRVRGERGLG